MKILVDTNVVLDVAMDRQPLAGSSREVLTWAFEHSGLGCLSWHSVATVAYFLTKQGDRERMRLFMGALASRLDIAGGSERELLRAIELDLPDFEDAMVVAVAESVEATHIVTRNLQDFRKSPVKAVTPEQFMRLVAKT